MIVTTYGSSSKSSGEYRFGEMLRDWYPTDVGIVGHWYLEWHSKWYGICHIHS